MSGNTKKTENQSSKKPIIISENRDFKGVWIPRKLYVTRKFSPNEKFLLVEIYSLTSSKSKKCFASNKHFADFIGLKENTIQKMLLNFEKSGYIKREYERNDVTGAIQSRCLILTNEFYKEFINENQNEEKEDQMEKNQGGMEKNPPPMEKNPVWGGKKSTRSNNTLSNTVISDNSKNTLNTFSEKKGKRLFPTKEKESKARTRANHPSLNSVYAQSKAILACSKIDGIDEIEKSQIAYTVKYFFDRYADYQEVRNLGAHPDIDDEKFKNEIQRIWEGIELEDGSCRILLGDEDAETGRLLYEEMIDEFFATDWGKNNGGDFDYHFPLFANNKTLMYLFNRVSGEIIFPDEIPSETA